jgi:hypothetical protein
MGIGWMSGRPSRMGSRSEGWLGVRGYGDEVESRV